MTNDHSSEIPRFKTSFAGITRALPGAAERILLLLVACLIGSVYYLYQFHGVTDVGYEFTRTTPSVFAWIYDRWISDWRDTQFAHSHWIPLISLALVWIDRRTLIVLPRQVNWLGFALVVFSLAIHWAGVKSEQTRLSILSLITLSWSLPFFICGWPIARRLIFPCAFLLFSLPLNFFDTLVHPFRIIAASTATGFINGLGLAVERNGPVIISATGDFRVDLADSPSSIFAVTAMGAYALLCAYVIRASLVRRLTLVASTLPMFVLATMIRGSVIMALAVAFGDSVGIFVRDHLSGPIMVVLVFGGLTALAWKLHDRKPQRKRTSESRVTHPSSSPSPVIAVAISLVVVIAAIWWIPSNLAVTHREEAGVRWDWPDTLGEWNGEDILYCHNPLDAQEFMDNRLNPGDPCPSCGEPLIEMTPVEKALLPPDTLVRKKHYASSQKRGLFLSIVLSGKYRSSIHRPEVCLVGPNSRIAKSFIHEVPLADGRRLKVKVLEMVIQTRNNAGEPVMAQTYYAYWFAGINRETPSHLRRMIWMASDRLFKSESYRWAYLSVAGFRTVNPSDYLAELDSFLQQAYPHLIRD